jgi:hypothetical protein
LQLKSKEGETKQEEDDRDNDSKVQDTSMTTEETRTIDESADDEVWTEDKRLTGGRGGITWQAN